MLAWTEMDALEMVGNVKIVNVFWRQSQKGFVNVLVLQCGERAKGDPKACHPSCRDGVATYCSYSKASSPAHLLQSSAISESSECTQNPSWAGGHVWKKRTESYAIHCSPQGWSGDDRACVPFKVHVRSKKKKKKNHPYGFFQLPEPHLQELFSS